MSVQTIMGATVTVEVTDTTAATAINAKVPLVRVHNSGPNTAYIKFGNSDAEAATTDFPVPFGTTVTLDKGKAGYVATVAAATHTATVYFSPVSGN